MTGPQVRGPMMGPIPMTSSAGQVRGAMAGPMSPPPAPAPARPNKPYSQWHWKEKRAAVKRTGHRAHKRTPCTSGSLMAAASEVLVVKTERAKDDVQARNREEALKNEKRELKGTLEAERQAAAAALAEKAARERAPVGELATAKAMVEDYRKDGNEKIRDINDANRRIEVFKIREFNRTREMKRLED